MEKNIYIENHEEISHTTHAGKLVDVGVALDIFDNNHGCKHDDRARAEYIARFAPDSLSIDYKRLLEDAE